MSNAARSTDPTSLARSLLREPVDGGRRRSRWAYPWWLMIGISLFVAYHGFCLIVLNLPSKGVTSKFIQWVQKDLGGRQYFRATGNSQSWGMFAPNPLRTNQFLRVYVEDKNGEVWDLAHDIYDRRTYPYLFYDRMGKVNRRVYDGKGYMSVYAAWVCREWARDHDGEAPKEVRFKKMWTKVPPPSKVRRGFDPMKLHLHEREADTFRCESIVHGQLPNELRERYGFPLRPEDEFRDVHLRTWWDRQQGEKDDGS